MARPTPDLYLIDRFPFRSTTTTRVADLDPNDHINNVAMIAAMEDARTRFGQSLDRAALDGLDPMIAGQLVDYLAEGSYPDPIELHVGVLRIGSRSWEIATLARQRDRPVAFSRATLVLVAAGTDGPSVDMPPAWRRALEAASLK